MAKSSKKDSILATAKRLFAEKGYDATGMEEIAAETKATKSLIYYHFKNKEDLLNTILDGFLDEYKRILKDDSERGIHKISRYISFLENNKDCLRIILTESLKGTNSNKTRLFETLDLLLTCTKEVSDDFEDRQAEHLHMVAEFFTSILPSILFVCYEENWCDYFGVKKEELTRDFLQTYELTHGAYHEYIKRDSL